MRNKVALLFLLCAGLALSNRHAVQPIEAAGGSAAKCSDIPLRVTLYNNAVTDPTTGATVASALQADGGGEYINGGVSALIKVCDGTNDAVLNVTSAKRTFTFNFPSPIAGSVIQSVPSWVPGLVSVSGWINVRNIIFNKGQEAPFTTHMG